MTKIHASLYCIALGKVLPDNIFMFGSPVPVVESFSSVSVKLFCEVNKMAIDFAY